MKYFSLSLSLLMRNVFLNILISLQLCAAIIFGVISFAVIGDAYTRYDMTADLEGDYLYMSNNENALADGSVLKQCVEEGSAEVYQSLSLTILGRNTLTNEATLGVNYDFRAYSAALGNAFKGQVKKGKWYSDAERQDGVINCVVIGPDTLPIGTEIPLGIYRTETEKNEEGKLTVKFVLSKAYVFRVVGWLGTSAEVFTFHAAQSPAISANVNELFQTIGRHSVGLFENLNSSYHGEEDDDKTTILCDLESLQIDDVDFGMFQPISQNAVIRVLKNSEEVLTTLSAEAGIVSVSRARENALARAKAKTAQYMPILCCFLAMATIGSMCVGVLNISRNKQVFRAYNLCGMSFSQNVILILVCVAILFVLAIIESFVGWALLSAAGTLPWGSMSFGVDCVLFAVFCALAMFALMVGVQIFMVRDNFGEEQ